MFEGKLFASFEILNSFFSDLDLPKQLHKLKGHNQPEL